MKTDVGACDDLKPGSRMIVEVDGKSIGVFNIGGTYHAVLNHCPHHDAPVCRGRLSGTMVPSNPGEYVGGLRDMVLRCPWHGWEFNIETGKCIFGVDRSSIRIYPVSVESGRILVELSSVRRASLGS